MRFSIVLSAVCAAVALAAPAYPELNIKAATPTAAEDLNEYFNLLSQKIASGKQMATSPVCDLSKAVLPVACESHPARPALLLGPQGETDTAPIAPTALPAVSPGLVLKHVAVGRGTQNYTCDLSNSTAVPSAVGAVATLFNATCVAATYPDLLNTLPRVALAFNLSTAGALNTGDDAVFPNNLLPASTNQRLAPGNAMISGHHFFTTTTTPFFNLDTTNFGQLGEAACAKNASVAAPADAAKGQGGEAAVPWLKLTAKEGATGRIQEVYRVETAGGSQPATCAGMPASFEVQYSAE